MMIDVGRPDHLLGDQVYDQVFARYGKMEISDACAVTIASWWQSPGGWGYAMAQLASTGRVPYDTLHEAIYQARKEAEAQGSLRDVQALDMLGTWALRKSLEA